MTMSGVFIHSGFGDTDLTGGALYSRRSTRGQTGRQIAKSLISIFCTAPFHDRGLEGKITYEVSPERQMIKNAFPK